MPVQQPPPQEYARVALIIILLFFLYTSPDQNSPPGFQTPHDYAAEHIDRARHALDVLNVTKWQNFAPKSADTSRYDAPRYLNLTGFREEDDYAWERLEAFKKRSGEFSDEARLGSRLSAKSGHNIGGEVYQNMSGIVTGRWVRHTADLNGEPRRRVLNLTEIAPVIDWAFRDEEYWTRNITGTEGKLMLRVEERDVEKMVVELPSKVSAGHEPFHEVRGVAATLTIQDESSSGDGWETRLHGVHWINQGVLLMTTTSEKFSGIFGLPHLAMDQSQFVSSQKLLNRTLEKTVEKMEEASWMDLSNPWTASPDNPGDGTMPVPHCEYIVYVQTYPVNVDQAATGTRFSPEKIIDQIEMELRFPNGAPISAIPEMKMSTVILSPDCGFMLESKGPPSFPSRDGEHLKGKKQEVFLHDIQNWLHTFAAIIFGQILLLKMQSKEASTPSTVGRVSLYTIAMMLMADALLFSSLSLLSATAPNLFPSALLTSFGSLMSVALGVRFISAVYNVQEPERREALRVEQAAEAASRPARPAPPTQPQGTARTAPQPIPIVTAAGADISPPAAPVTTATNTTAAPTNTRPIIVPSDQDIDAEIAENVSAAASAPLLPIAVRPAATQPPPRSTSNFGAVYVKFSLTLTFILFLTLSSISWSIPFRTAYIHIMSFTYLSFWVPQIRRNVIRNCRKALLWKFIVGQSTLRLLPFVYFYLKEDNILFATTDWKAFCVLAGWVWIQIWILVAQEVLGPRWGLPKSWYEEGWDYHPILSEDAVESGGLPIGLVRIPDSPTLDRANTGDSTAGRKKKDSSVRSVDCAICMQNLEVPVVAAGEDVTGPSAAGGVAGLLARRQYMVTPCRHVFHSTCLEGWMRFRLQCPICRENLPPL